MKTPVVNFGNFWSRSVGRWALLAALVLCVLAACGEKSAAPDSEKVPPVQTEAPSETASVQKEKVGVEIKETYQWYCAQCHGMKGKGDGINAKMTTVLPRDHTKASYLEGRTNEQLFQAIKLGGLAVGRAPCMPAWGHTLKEKTMRGLVHYIRELCNCEGPPG